jgi:cytochrome c biogenesis protein ResB
VIGISGIVGIVLAHLNRGKSEAWLESHYTWAIRTFWLGLLGSPSSASLLFFVIIGMFTIILVALWIIIRTCRAAKARPQRAHRQSAKLAALDGHTSGCAPANGGRSGQAVHS